MPPKKESVNAGYLPINRKFFAHPLWKERRTFSKSEAWLDLVQAARFEESQANELMGGRMVSWSRGQLPASLRYLSERWMWSKNKVSDFLALLEEEKMIKKVDVNGQTVITLCNYDYYNQKGQRKGHVTDSIPDDSEEVGDSKKDERGTAKGQQGDKTNKVNKENNDVQAHTPDDISKYKAFTGWIEKYAVNVSKMKEPFTIEQYIKLRNKLPQNQVQALLLKMHNWKPLLQKNNSAYLTILNWNSKDYNSGNGPKNKVVVV